LQGVNVKFNRLDTDGHQDRITDENGHAHITHEIRGDGFSLEAVCNKAGYIEQRIIVPPNEPQYLYLERSE
jgi:hypothetical protein